MASCSSCFTSAWHSSRRNALSDQETQWTSSLICHVQLICQNKGTFHLLRRVCWSFVTGSVRRSRCSFQFSYRLNVNHARLQHKTASMAVSHFSFAAQVSRQGLHYLPRTLQLTYMSLHGRHTRAPNGLGVILQSWLKLFVKNSLFHTWSVSCNAVALKKLSHPIVVGHP